ncbi:MAG: hypothetical protein WBF13_11585 [Candidatus Zixiibacteriota bacterium]
MNCIAHTPGLPDEKDTNAHNSLPETCLEPCPEEKSEKNKKPPETPEAPVKHHHSRKAEKKRK